MVSWRRYLYASTIGIRSAGKGECGVRTEDELIWLETSSKTMYTNFDSSICNTRFTRCNADHCCYVKSFENSYIILPLYVDDMLVAGSSIGEIQNLKKQLSN
jgi:hypothetical protein